ncbi:MAG: MFS transporter [Bacteroidetes bacterium]|nr:MFS transporter [Bacteroidota bacterium]MCL5027380.1 MFS transporter [Chloroflexota bacterium]
MARSVPASEGIPLPERPEAKGWRRTFAALSGRDYRYFWMGLLAFYSAMQMQTVAQGWLVYEMTESAVALGAVTFAIGLPLLALSPLGGVAADRVDKRRLLMMTQLFLAVISSTIAVLIATELIEVWHLMAASALKGTIFAFNMPARQAFIAELAPEKDLMNAIALNSTGMNLTRVMMPGAAGLFIGIIDVAGVYAVMTLLYIVAMVTLSLVTPRPARPKTAGVPFLRELTVGASYIAKNPVIPTLIALELFSVLFAMQYQVLMPVFAVSVLDTGPAGLGYLLSAVGIGGLLGSLFVASLGDFKHKGRLDLAAAAAFGVMLFLFTQARSFELSLLLLALTGVANITFSATNNTLIMTNSLSNVRGRVMSVYLMCWGVQPLAALPIGALADTIGAPLTVAIGASILTLAAATLFAFRPVLRHA